MGLAGPKVKTKVGVDPRNTFWTSNTERFGHKYLSNLGWTPGTALGDKSSSYHSSGHISSASHTGVKIVLKDDTLGIGAKKGAQDGECTGLLGLEGLLGRLNGDEEKVKRVQMEEERRKNEWVGGRYGVVFVRGEVWTGEDFSKLIKKPGKEKKEEKAESKEEKKKEKKRKRGDDGESKEKRSRREKSAASEDESRKRSKSRSKSKSKTPSGNDESSNEDTSAGADVSEDSSTSKKRKKSEKKEEGRSEESKKEKKKRKKEEKAERKARKAEKKKRKEKAQKDDESSSSESESETQASGSATPVFTAPPQVQKRVLVGRHAVRARFIAAKRSAVMDAAALNEILMIKA
ncbi:hypothetical protein EX30DRAFT_362454 [Ascodesmis nigricans]|uniref:G-patch domain-containing protein n=1 Tax=Ascodesmis nigricans TaxID=341454 RepID=A0A4S2N1A2_9PEZI|nr:hypothetical protein EX30DRAFT_362454 [Ascodesmis nigricans]